MENSGNNEARLPSYTKATLETNDYLIKKFLKDCSKDSLMLYITEKSADTRVFVKKSVKTRQKKLRYKRNAKKFADKSREVSETNPKQKNR